MPKVLPARFSVAGITCIKCRKMRKLCSICVNCVEHCKCKDIPPYISDAMDRCLERVRVLTYKNAMKLAGTDPLSREHIHEALSEIDFQGIFERHFPAPKEVDG